MANRHNHYEAAFEDYLRAERVPYVAVNERRRALDAEGSLKNVDFILSSTPSASGLRWLVDVKGRRFPAGNRRKQYWRNWATAEELDSLGRWSTRFGPRFEAALVFAYLLVADRTPVPPEQVHYFREAPYAFVAAPLLEYREAAQTLSPSWGTVATPVADFRRIARPIHELICQGEAVQTNL